MLLRSPQRSGRLMVPRVLPRFSVDLFESIADPASAVESDMVVDESSLVCHLNVSDKRV